MSDVRTLEPRLVSITQPRSSAAEQYRALRTSLEFLGVARPLHKVLVTSAVPESGKSLTAANLALALAQGGRSTLLVDADLRRPSQHHLFGLPNLTGLTSAVTRGGELGQYLAPGPLAELRIMTSGPIPPNPSEILGSMAMRDILQQLEAEADTVVLDSPPVVGFTDAVILSNRNDGVIYVVRAGFNSRKADLKALELLRQVDARILGVVLNDLKQPDESLNYAYYYNRRPVGSP
jgi:capsular exopolysaccharide synthesis family protein